MTKSILKILCRRMEFLQQRYDFFLLSSQDKEVECGGPAPRVLSLDDYFITEVEKEERDPDTGKKVKKKVVLILLLFLAKKQDILEKQWQSEFQSVGWEECRGLWAIFRNKPV